MAKAKTIVKICEITCVHLSGSYETKNTRFNVKYPIAKVIKNCLKLGFSFKVGIRNNTLIHNMSYIEIINDWFTKNTFDERIARDSQCNELKTWLHRGEHL